MFRPEFSEKGMMLITILMLTFLLVMLTTSMIVISSESLNITGKAEKKAKALQAAEAGVEYAFYQLNTDSTWSPSLVEEQIGDGQSFKIIFDGSHSKNNLMNKDPNGTTPGYSVEIICEGNYKDILTQKLRAIFVRDDVFSYPVCSEGNLRIDTWPMSGPCTFIVKSKTGDDPGRIHSNSSLTLWRNAGPPFDFNDGFVSTTDTGITYFVNGAYQNDSPDIKRKVGTAPVKIPDIDVAEIITKRPVDPNLCLSLSSDDKFYLIGYFEYYQDPLYPNDPDYSYCIPHKSFQDISTDPAVYGTDYKFGVASFSENNCATFLSNYTDFYTNPYPWLSGGEDRNFYDYYGDITFSELDPNITPCEYGPLEIELSEDIQTISGYDLSFVKIKLKKDLYLPGIVGLFGTTGSSYNIINVDGVTSTKFELDMDGHSFYVERPFYLGIPPSNEGSIISNETIDFHFFHDIDMVTLSEKSIRLVYLENLRDVESTYNGILYAKDDIVIGTSDTHACNKFNIKGCIISKDEYVNSNANPPLWRHSYIYSSDNLRIIPIFLTDMLIEYSDTGLDKLVNMRGNNFKVRKQFCEVLD